MTPPARRPGKTPPKDGAKRGAKGGAKSGARSGAQALVAQLEAIGVEVVFGVPGVHNLPIFEALRTSETIRTIVTRHEQAAAYAADGYARATGRLGVCITTTGPGAANTAAAMGEARMARSPVLHISTQLDTRSLEGRSGRFQLHESPDQLDLMRAVCRWAGRIQREDAVAQMVLRAAREAFNGRRGPAFLEIPLDLLPAEVGIDRVTTRSLFDSLPPNPNPIVRAAEKLQRTKKPVIWVGGGAISSGAADELTAVAEMLDAPVVTTYSGKGAIPASHPLAVGLPPHQPEVTALIESSDAMLIVGSDLDAMNTQGWRIGFPRPRIGINIVGEDARRNYACDVLIESDARPALAALYEELSPASRKGSKRVADARKGALAKLKRLKESKEPFGFVQRLSDALPAGAFVVADMAVAGYWTAAYLTAEEPRRFAYPLGWGTLGFAFPAALGSAAAGRRSVVVCGDGGFLFSPGELATAAQEALPITVIVFDDGGYGMLRYDQKARFNATFAVDLASPDFVKMAAAFGVKAKKAPLADLEKALAWSLKIKGPSVIQIDAAWAPPITTSPRWPLKDRPEARP
ncbi:MAG TPA: thiamine pyrophosphate-binding protein [Actinomycetota bacterium]